MESSLPHQMLDPPTHQPPQFFTKLADVFNAPKTKGHGAVFLTQKRRTTTPPHSRSHHLTTPSSLTHPPTLSPANSTILRLLRPVRRPAPHRAPAHPGPRHKRQGQGGPAGQGQAGDGGAAGRAGGVLCAVRRGVQGGHGGAEAARPDEAQGEGEEEEGWAGGWWCCCCLMGEYACGFAGAGLLVCGVRG